VGIEGMEQQIEIEPEDQNDDQNEEEMEIPEGLEEEDDAP
jgi:hypothetical protein